MAALVREPFPRLALARENVRGPALVPVLRIPLPATDLAREIALATDRELAIVLGSATGPALAIVRAWTDPSPGIGPIGSTIGKSGATIA